jgi:hypothetical protein
MPNPDKPELKIEDLLMSLRSVLFKSEDILSQFFCLDSKEITTKDLNFLKCLKWLKLFSAFGGSILNYENFLNPLAAD